MHTSRRKHFEHANCPADFEAFKWDTVPIFSEVFVKPLPQGVISARPLLSGDAGVEQTIDQMRQLVDQALRDPAFIRFATDIVRSVPPFDDFAEAHALYEWVRQNIRFTKDPVNKEKLYPPQELLEIRAGDCDDISMLLGAMLMAVGYPARLVTVAASPQDPDAFSHVYVEAEVGGQWIPLDPARYDSQFGIAPPVTYRKRWWSLSDNSYGDLSGVKIQNVHPGATVNVNLSGYPRFQSFLRGDIRRMHGIGDDQSNPAASDIATVYQGTADIIRASQGQAASPFSYAAAGPWSSFQTAYSPYGVSAGYLAQYPYGTQPTVALTGTSNWILWVAIIGGVLLMSGRR